MVLCGWASNGETGHARGNKAGDQTGNEVKTGNWYKFGQKAVYRWKDRNKAILYASIIKYWCNNKNVGYDQNDRTTLGAWCKSHKWSYKVDTPVETDCSKMTGDGINCTLKKQAIPNDVWTGNLDYYLMKTGLFIKLTASKYIDEDDYLMTGDIINNPDRHVITALENGSKVIVTHHAKTIDQVAQEVIDGKWGTGLARKAKLQNAGYNYDEIQSRVNAILKKKKKSNTEIAKEVIDGKWGNGAARTAKLKAAGYDPVAIQKLVNKMVG